MPCASRAGVAVTLAAVLLLALFCPGQARCSFKSVYVGFQGRLTMMEHNVGGNVRILDDCTMQITGFTYDGRAPAAYWWGAPSTDYRSIRGRGRRIASQQVVKASRGSTITVTLLPGLTWDQFPVISLWCEAFYADFGHVRLQKQRRG